MLRCVVWQKTADVSELLNATVIIIIIVVVVMEAVNTSETSVQIHQTTQHNFHETVIFKLAFVRNWTLTK
jgi:hypothetical protein